MYLDNAATTKPSKEVISAVNCAMVMNWYNPSSNNQSARLVREEIEKVRKLIAEDINCDPEEIFFTSGGSEGNNMIVGQYELNTTCSPVEHPSIKTIDDCFRLFSLNKVDKNGLVDPYDLAEYINHYGEQHGNEMISIMAVNNETGTKNDIEMLSKIAHENGFFFHTDAVQAYGHFKIDVKKLGIDAMTVSGHKINAPKGTGFVYIGKALQKRIYPLVYGEQERGFRGGTENVPGIFGLGAAIKELPKKRACYFSMQEHKMFIMDELSERIPNVKFNNQRMGGHPGLLSITLPGIDGEALQMALELKNIIVSGRSACSSNSKEPSHVLKAIGLTDDESSSTIRVSFDENFTHSDAIIFIDTLCQCVRKLGGHVNEIDG